MRPRLIELRDHLVADGQAFLDAEPAPIRFTGNAAADLLLNDLTAHPHAFVFAALVDRQVPAERAWIVPAALRERLGGFDFQRLAALSGPEWLTVMRMPTPAHRLPETMAKVLFLAAQRIATHYRGDAALIWSGYPSSAALVRRFLEFHGAGPKIATMATNILVRDFKVRSATTGTSTSRQMSRSSA